MQRALHRLTIINAAGLLTGDEKTRLADILWDPSRLDEGGWPQRFALREFAILALPERTSRQAETAFRHRYLSQSDNQSAEQRIATVGTALSYTRNKNITFALNDDEKSLLVGAIQTWAEKPVAPARHGLELVFSQMNRETDDFEVLSSLIDLLPVVSLPEEQARFLWTRLGQVEDEHPERVLELYPMLLRYLPDSLEPVARKLREGLVSSNGRWGRGACVGVSRWMTQHEGNAATPAPPEDLTREIGNGIVVRRPAILIPGLEFAKWLIHKGPESYRPLLLDGAAQALAYLLEEAKYDGPFAGRDDLDLPLLRLRCVQLARTLAAFGHATNEAVQTWVDSAAMDPLPEIRKALLDQGTPEHPIELYA